MNEQRVGSSASTVLRFSVSLRSMENPKRISMFDRLRVSDGDDELGQACFIEGAFWSTQPANGSIKFDYKFYSQNETANRWTVNKDLSTPFDGFCEDQGWIGRRFAMTSMKLCQWIRNPSRNLLITSRPMPMHVEVNGLPQLWSVIFWFSCWMFQLKRRRVSFNNEASICSFHKFQAFKGDRKEEICWFSVNFYLKKIFWFTRLRNQEHRKSLKVT